MAIIILSGKTSGGAAGAGAPCCWHHHRSPPRLEVENEDERGGWRRNNAAVTPLSCLAIFATYPTTKKARAEKISDYHSISIIHSGLSYSPNR